MLAMRLEVSTKLQRRRTSQAIDGQLAWKGDSETFETNRIAQTSLENPVESLWAAGVSPRYRGVNGRWCSLLLDDGISLISIYQGRGNCHPYDMISLVQASIEPGLRFDTPIEDAIESHCGRTIASVGG